MRPRAALLAVLLAFGVGCSDDVTTTIDPGPTGDPSIALVNPEPGAEPSCVSIGDDAEARIPLLVDVEQMLLRPPGGCTDIAQCGRLVLFAEEVVNNETSVPAIDLLVGKLGDPYHDGTPHAGTGEPDVLDVRIEIWSEADEVMLDRDEEPLAVSVQLLTVPDCDAL